MTLKTDRRSRRSQKLLFEALLNLIEEKDYADITVSEIAERADVARVTFYAHFDSKEALLLSSLDELFARAAEMMGGFSRADLEQGTYYPALGIFSLVAENPKLFEVILLGRASGSVSERFRVYAAEGADRLLGNLGCRLSVPRKTVSDFVAGALLSVVTGWLERGMRTTPMEMERRFHALIRPSLLNVLSLK